MFAGDSKSEEDVHVLAFSLKKLSLSSNLSISSFLGKHCENKVDVELPKSGLSISHCTRSDIIKRLGMRSEKPTIIQLNNEYLLNKLNTCSASKEQSEEDKKIIDVATFFSELTVSCEKSDYVDDVENKMVMTVQKRGKFPPIHPNSQTLNVCPYSVNRPHHNEDFHKNLLHLSGCTVSYSHSNDAVHVINPINVDTNIEITREDSLNAIYEDGYRSPESGYGSPGSVSSLCLPHLPSFTSTNCLPSKSLENVLNVGKNIPDEEKDEVLNDITQLIFEDQGLKNSNCNCEAKVTLLTPIYIFTMINSPPTKTKQLRTILPKPSNTDVKIESNRRNLLKCHLNPNEIQAIARNIYSRKREEKRKNEKNVIFIEDLKTKRTNLHIAVIKEELEHVYCLIEIQMQFSQEWKDVAIAFNLEDTAHKTALDYANEVKTGQKSSLIAYLEKAGAKSRLEKKQGK